MPQKVTPKPMNVAALEHMVEHGCAVPGCDHKSHDGVLWIHARCHPKEALGASYTRGSGVLQIYCMACKALVCEISVGLV